MESKKIKGDKGKSGKVQGQNFRGKHSADKKRKFREAKYKQAYGSKAEGHGFAEQRKMKMVHQYRRLLKKERAKAAALGTVKPDTNSPEEEPEQMAQWKKKQKKKSLPFQKAMHEAEQKKKEKEERQKLVASKQAERESALKEYQNRKQKRHKTLAKKTFRGQPSMGGRMQLLLEQIESQR